MKKFLISILFLILFFGVLIPTSDVSDAENIGKLIQNHIDTAIEFQESYITLLAISTVNHENEIGDDFKPFESVFYVRELIKKEYRLETYTITDSKGNTKTATRRILVKKERFYGQTFIDFMMKYYKIDFNKLMEYKKAKEILKMKESLPEETASNGNVITYEVNRVFDLEEIFKGDDFKKDWFQFLAIEDGIKSVYGDETFLESAIAGVDGYAPYDPSKDDIVSFAKKYLGTPYLWGAASGNTDAFDCSTYTMWIYKNVLGHNLPRVSYDQYKSLKKINNTSDLQTGDLVFFYTGAGNVHNPITHVGMYIGNGEFIHASEDGVMVSKFDKDWRRMFRGGGRL